MYFLDKILRRAITLHLTEINHVRIPLCISIHSCSFSEYVNSLRLNYARQLLERTDMTILTIAEESGFGSSSTFYDTFHNQYHMTPTEMRSQKQSKKISQPW
ncbi:MAG: helix-turn-helix domain-containing protein [Lachnospiraceae bacterium]